jgi:YD repeat-containing protein
MVAIVSGNSLGLELTSADALGQRGVFGPASLGQSQERTYVNVATGNLVIQDQDDYIESRGLDVAALRTYNSLGLMNDDSGDNWSNGFYQKQMSFTGTAGTTSSVITRTAQDGSQATYLWSSEDNAYISRAGAGATDKITYTSNQFRWTDGPTGFSEVYDVKGADWARLASATDNCGHTTTYGYTTTTSALVNKVTSHTGEQIQYIYSGTKLTNIKYTDTAAVTKTHVTYGYDSYNRLKKVTVDLTATDASLTGTTYVTDYTYESSTTKRVKSITQSDGTTVSFAYDSVTGKIASITDGYSKVTSFTYAAGKTTVTDALNNKTDYEFDTITGQLLKVTAPPAVTGGVSQVTEFIYENGDLKTVTDPLNQVTTMGYDLQGNLTSTVDAAGNRTERTFDGNNQVLTETVYAVPGATPGAPQVTRYVYDGTPKNLLRYVISAEGRVTEYRYDPVDSQQTSKREYYAQAFDTANLGVQEAAPLASVDSWTTGKAFYLTENRYDLRGQVDRVTRWNSVDANGVGVSDGQESITYFQRGFNGVLISTTSANNGVTSYVYDGLERVVKVTQKPDGTTNVVTTTTYDAANSKITVKQDNLLTTASVYDKNGRVVSVTQTNNGGSTVLGKTKYSYDASGNLLMIEANSGDVAQVRTFMLYDNTGRKVADVDGTGTLTEYIYNAANLVTHTITYSTAVLLSSLVNGSGVPLKPTLESIRPAKIAAFDLQAWNVYDAAYRLVRTVDGRGAVTEIAYDGASRIVSSTRRANALTSTQLGSLADAPDVAAVTVGANDTDDRVARNFYDSDGLLRGVLDAEGYLTEHEYNAEGQCVQSRRYWNPTDSTERADGTLDDLIPELDTLDRDAITTYLYDGKGRQVGVVDAEGYLTELVYDPNGNLKNSIRYSLTARTPVLTTSNLSDVKPLNDTATQTTQRVYDKLDRVTSETDAQGTVTNYTYDNVGNLAKVERAANDSLQLRKTLARYDIQGRLIAELSAEGAAAITDAHLATTSWAGWGVTHTYNMAGWRTSTTDAVGNKAFYYYNLDGRLTHTVNALGEVIESQYNAIGQLTAIVKYNTRISTGSLIGGLNTTLPVLTGTFSKTQYDYDATGIVTDVTDPLTFKKNYVYNTFGELSKSTEAIGRPEAVLTTMTYDRRGQVKETSADAGSGGINALTKTEYDAFGRLWKLTDPNAGTPREFNYDRLGRQVKVIDSAGASRSTVYDAFDRVYSTTDELGKTTGYTYDLAARSVKVTTPENVQVTTSFNRFGQTVSVSDARIPADLTKYEYDRNGSLTRTVGADGAERSHSVYDHAGRISDTYDGVGNRVTIAYDAANRIATRTVDPTGLNLATTYAWDAQGRQIKVTDAEGIATTFEYDAAGRLTKQTVDPTTTTPAYTGLNLVTTFSYDARNNTLTVTAPNGNAGTPNGDLTLYTYDKLNRRVREQVKTGTTVTPTPDPVNTGTTVTDRSYEYDEAGNMTRAIDGQGNATLYVYDAENQLAFVVDGMGGVTETNYNARGQVSKVTNHGTAISLTGLGIAPAIDTVRQRLSHPETNQVEYRFFDEDGWMTTTLNAFGSVVAYSYDQNGNVTERRAYAKPIDMAAWTEGAEPEPVADNARDERVRTVYDKLNRATHIANGAGGVTQRIYDGADNVRQIKQYGTAIGATAAADSVTANSLIDRLTIFAYDKANRNVYTVDANGSAVRNDYDSNGNLTRRTSYSKPGIAPAAPYAVQDISTAIGVGRAEDRIEQYAYDAANRLVYSLQATGTDSGSSLSAFTVQDSVYDASGNVIKSISRNKTLSLVSVPVDVTAAALKTSVLADAVFDRVERRAYDAANQLRYVVDGEGYAREYLYDAAGRVASSTLRDKQITSTTAITLLDIKSALGNPLPADRMESYGYDAAGRLHTRTDAYNNTETYEYDGIGRKQSFTNKKNATWTYTYDAAGRIETEITPEVSLPVDATPTTLKIVTRMAYDALGNMTSRTEGLGLDESDTDPEPFVLAETRTTAYEYDQLGRQTKTIYKDVGVYDDTETLATNGATSLATREETTQDLSTQTWYDALGNAVASVDQDGNYSYKSYDKEGNLAYEMDALGYITAYERNAFGEVKKLTRHATKNPIAPTPAGLTYAQMQGKVSTNGQDRAIDTEYDKAGRVTTVTEPQVYGYDAEAGTFFEQGAKVTTHTYNAFGELQRSFDGRGYTDHFYDERGLEVWTRDAMGFLTERLFNQAGDIEKVTEYATAVTVPGTYTQTPPTPSSSGDDRATEYFYDLLGRKTSELRYAVEVTNGTSAAGHAAGTLTISAPQPVRQTLTTTTPASDVPRITGGAFLAGADGSAIIKWPTPPAGTVATFSWRISGTDAWNDASSAIVTDGDDQTIMIGADIPAGPYELQLEMKAGEIISGFESSLLIVTAPTVAAPTLPSFSGIAGAGLVQRPDGVYAIQWPAPGANTTAAVRIKRNGTTSWDYLPTLTDAATGKQYAVVPKELAAGTYTAELDLQNLANGKTNVQTLYAYDAVGNLVQTTDALNGVTTTTTSWAV